MFLYIFLLTKCRQLLITFAKFFFFSAECLQQQQEFTNEIENMEVDELNKCLTKFFAAVRKTDGSYYKKTSLLSIRAALDRHLKAPKSFKHLSVFYFISSNNHQCNYTKTISLLRRREYRRGDYLPIFTSPSATNC